MPGVRHNYGYFPIFVDKDSYGMDRDTLYALMKSHNVYGRRYFYPLISDFAIYRDLPSAAPELHPNAQKMADEVICLPIHNSLTQEDVERVLDIIVNRR